MTHPRAQRPSGAQASGDKPDPIERPFILVDLRQRHSSGSTVRGFILEE